MSSQLPTFKPRKWQWPNPGRKDPNGTEWWACDAYPTWYRWTESAPGKGELITHGYPEGWDDEQ